MKKMLILSVLLTISSLFSQAQDGSEFDFWIGQWDLNWEYSDGSQGIGTNNILKTLDGKVIQENFEAIDTGPYSGFKGTSVSVFNPSTKTWHQAWADNQGGYYSFIGEIEENRRIFKTIPYHKDGKEIILRMVFYDIRKSSMTWDWEQSQDGGKTWMLQWRIKYKKAT